MSAFVAPSAEGFARRAFTVDEVLRMQEAGILDEDERFELIEGEIVLMQAKNFPHERIKLALIRAFIPRLAGHACNLASRPASICRTHDLRAGSFDLSHDGYDEGAWARRAARR